MTEVKCKRCKYKWDYKGKSKWYISCPRCRTTISIKKIKEKKQKVVKSEKGGIRGLKDFRRNLPDSYPIIPMVRGI